MNDGVLVSGIVAHEEISGAGRPAGALFGGAGLYTALAASRFAPTSLNGVVGRDLAPLLAALAEGRFDISRVAVVGTESVRLRGCYPPRSDALEILSVVWGPLGAPRSAVSVDGRPRVLTLGNDDPAHQLKLLHAAASEIVIYGTFGAWLRHRPAECRALHEAAHVVVVSEHESPALRDLASKPKTEPILVLTRGERGVEVIHGGTSTKVPAPRVSPAEIRDVTGAGDALLGAMAGWLAAKGGPVDATAVAEAVRAASPVIVDKLSSVGAEAFAARLFHSRGQE